MICAEDEIGLGTSHDGIMVLSPDAVVGTPAANISMLKATGRLKLTLHLTVLMQDRI
jgi:phenylalanyl-tRNA synthetase beta chain